jgi:hypothetical protein
VDEEVVVGSPASQAPLSFKSKHTVAPAYTVGAALAGEEAAAVSANTGGVKFAPPTTPWTMVPAKAEAEPSARALATAAATRVGRGVLMLECIFK